MGCGGSKEAGSGSPVFTKVAKLKHGFAPDRFTEERLIQLALQQMKQGRKAVVDRFAEVEPAINEKRDHLLALQHKSDHQFAAEVVHIFLSLGVMAKAKVFAQYDDGATPPTGPEACMRVHPRPSWTAENHYILDSRQVPPFPEGLQMCVFAAGCFWGTEKGFWRLPGVYSTAVGYIGGHLLQPTYKAVCSGRSGHTEGTLVVYDPARISMADLLRRFLDAHDPTQGNGQGNDRGSQYRSGVYTSNKDQAAVAKKCLGAFGDALTKHGYPPITTEVKTGKEFWFAEEYHRACTRGVRVNGRPKPSPSHLSRARLSRACARLAWCLATKRVRTETLDADSFRVRAEQYLAKPGSRQYCSAEPTGVPVPLYDEWQVGATLADDHRPLLPPSFWASYDGSIRAPNTPVELSEPALREAAAQREAAEEVRVGAEAAARTTAAVALLRFCGGCGFKPRAEELATHLQDVAGIELALLQDVGTTGNFEVEVRGADRQWVVVHSKKGAGDGFIDSEEKIEKLMGALAAAPGVATDPTAWMREKLPAAKAFAPIERAKQDERLREEARRDEAAQQVLREEVDLYISMAPALVFSKSFCPFCKKAKALFAASGVHPVVFELDHRFDGPAIQAYLDELTGQRTVPSIWLDGKHVGGWTDFEKLAKGGKLKPRSGEKAELLAVVKSKGLLECGAADGVPCLCGATHEQLEAGVEAEREAARRSLEQRERAEAERKYPGCTIGSEELMAPKAHGTSDVPPLPNLRWGVDTDTADRVCNFNRHFAEHAGYFEETRYGVRPAAAAMRASGRARDAKFMPFLCPECRRQPPCPL